MRASRLIFFFAYGRKLPRLQKDACNKVDNGGNFIRRRIHAVDALAPKVGDHCAVGEVGNEPAERGGDHWQAEAEQIFHQSTVNVAKREHAPQLCAPHDKSGGEQISNDNRENVPFNAHSQHEQKQNVAKNG